MTIVTLVLTGIICFGAGIFFLYTMWKLKMLEEVILNFPTTTEIAKEVLKVKLPLSEVPPEQLEKFKQLLQKMKAERNIDDVDGLHGKVPAYVG